MDPASGWLLFALALASLLALCLWVRCGRLEKERDALAAELRQALRAAANGAPAPRKRSTMWD
jgi:hypothetical protein